MRILRIVVVVLIALAVTPIVGAKKNRMTLNEANERWAGARCRSQVDITLTDKKPDQGWTKCRWIFRTEERGNDRVRVLLTEGDRVRARYLGGTLPAGSEFVAVGWRTEKPNGKGSLYLELEHVELGARAQVFYGKDWVSSVQANSLSEFEQWARLSMFEIVEAPSEQLVEVDSLSPVGVENPATTSVPAEPFDLRVLGTTAEPLSVSPGKTVVLAITYEVLGVSSGRTVEVLERRAIVRDGRVLTTLEAKVRRGPGTHRSTQDLTVPASLEPGVLEVHASVHATGMESAGKTLFQVVSP